MLSRMLKYADKRFDLGKAADSVTDTRPRPQISCGTIVRELFVMFLARLGSLNALEQHEPKGLCKKWIGGRHPSADRVGDVSELIAPDDLREIMSGIYQVLRKGNNLPPMTDGHKLLVLDGHEMSSSYHRRCPGCLERKINTKDGERTQYYHRYVLAMLVHGKGSMPLDIEPQLQGEDERSAAMRLLERMLQRYPRAFQIIGGDALYMDPKLWLLADKYGKYFIAVVKNEKTDLLSDARNIFNHTQPKTCDEGTTKRTVWDIEGFTTWPQLGYPVRIIRSIEQKQVRRQRTGITDTIESEWIWATNMPTAKLNTSHALTIGHRRWNIENQGFNQIVQAYKGDHLYRHHPQAIVNLLLVLLIACLIFQIAINNNLKSQIRGNHTESFLAEKMKAELHAVAGLPP